MLTQVHPKAKSFRKYIRFLSPFWQKRFFKLRNKLFGKRIMHINSTPEGGGVAEILNGLVPLEKDLGLKAEWYTMEAPFQFFNITKKIHNGLQGKNVRISKAEKDFYLKVNRKLSFDILRDIPDILVIHDPQPLGASYFIKEEISLPIINRIHIDLSTPALAVLKFMRPYFKKADVLVFSLKEFIPNNFSYSQCAIFPPAIDPLSDKNKDLSQAVISSILRKFKINSRAPLISQISRFDFWKNPLGVIRAYFLARRKIPSLQLALIGFTVARDDPDAGRIIKDVKKAAKGDKGIFIFHDPKILGRISNDIFVNAIQRASNIVIQNSIREGFGLSVSEAMWKRKPVIVGKAGGLVFQVREGREGFIVKNNKELADRIVQLIQNKRLASRLGKAGYLRVKNNFLIMRLVYNHLRLYARLLNRER